MLARILENEPANTYARGAIGVGTPVLGFAVSKLPEIEQWLRVTSLCIGILVGLLTACSLVVGMIRKREK